LGFASRASVLRGEPVTLHVSTTSRAFLVSAFRFGWYAGDLARKVWQSGSVRGHRQRAHVLTGPTRTVSCDWEPSLTVQTHDWPEGCYLLRLDAESGAQRFIPLTIRSASTAGKVVFKNAVATWQAYNLWGGYDLYLGPGGYNDRSLAVSLDRPYDKDGARQFQVFERKLVSIAERLGLPMAYVTSFDIAADPRLLAGASALISPGHDEYWSPPERQHVTAARNAGVNIAFFGANAMFRRTRLAATKLGDDRLIICYKTSYPQDPMYGKHDSLVTSDWREPPDPLPESSLTGTLYESNPVTADYVVAAPDAWVFAGTGVRKGARFRGLVGDEYDRVNPGAPVERPMEVLAHSPLTCRGVNSYSDSAYYTHAGGAGVFNSGTMRWVQSLLRPYGSQLTPECGRFTRKVTANILRGFADGPAAHKHPARDNLASMHEWPGDPIAAKHNLWPPVVL
jgi:N,N-dimethylformamidase beta subunit-like, C-terminal